MLDGFTKGIRKKIDHISIGVSNNARAKRFYDAVFQPLGYKCLDKSADSLGDGEAKVELWNLTVDRPVRADEAVGLQFCFAAPTQASVDSFYQAAVAAGGGDNGKPGPSPDYGPKYYGAFVTDPHGYRLEAHCGR